MEYVKLSYASLNLLRKCAVKNRFYQSVFDYYCKYGHITLKQFNCLRRGLNVVRVEDAVPADNLSVAHPEVLKALCEGGAALPNDMLAAGYSSQSVSSSVSNQSSKFGKSGYRRVYDWEPAYDIEVADADTIGSSSSPSMRVSSNKPAKSYNFMGGRSSSSVNLVDVVHNSLKSGGKSSGVCSGESKFASGYELSGNTYLPSVKSLNKRGGVEDRSDDSADISKDTTVCSDSAVSTTINVSKPTASDGVSIVSSSAYFGSLSGSACSKLADMYKDEATKLGFNSYYYGASKFYEWQISKLPVFDLPAEVEVKLKSFQVPLVKEVVGKLLSNTLSVNSQLLAWDMGAGKTYGAAGIIRSVSDYRLASGLSTEPVGVFVICPKSVIGKWRSVLSYFGVHLLGISNYEAAVRGKEVRSDGKLVDCEYINCVFDETKAIPRVLSYKFNFPNGSCILFDELHRCKNQGTMNSKLAVAGRHYLNSHSSSFGLGLSGTLAESPLKTWASGYFLGLYDSKSDFYSRVIDFGASQTGYNDSWEFKYPSLFKNMNLVLFPRIGSRVKFSDIPDAPNQSVGVEFVSHQPTDSVSLFSGAAKSVLGRYSEAVSSAKAKLKDAVGMVKFRKLSGRDGASYDLLCLLRERQLRELEKLPYLYDRVLSCVSSGERCVVFLNFTESVEILYDAFRSSQFSAGVYDGVDRGRTSDGLSLRDYHLKLFQLNSLSVLVCNIEAAKEGIDMHDTSVGHRFPRVTFFSPCYNAQTVSQALGRVHRVGGGFCRQVFVVSEGTVEEKVWSSIAVKLDSLDDLNDGESVLCDSIKVIERDCVGLYEYL